MKAEDEFFVDEVLAELRDGETVTILTSTRREREIRRRLEELGATDDELARVVWGQS